MVPLARPAGAAVTPRPHNTARRLPIRPHGLTTVNSDWHQSANSPFAEPSRLEGKRRRRSRRRITAPVIGALIAISLTLLALWVMLARLMSR